MNIPPSQRRLAKIRCLQECIRCFKETKKLPECLCYVPSEVEYRCNGHCFIKVHAQPQKTSERIRGLNGTSDSKLTVSGEDLCNASGRWLRILKVSSSNHDSQLQNNVNVLILKVHINKYLLDKNNLFCCDFHYYSTFFPICN